MGTVLIFTLIAFLTVILLLTSMLLFVKAKIMNSQTGHIYYIFDGIQNHKQEKKIEKVFKDTSSRCKIIRETPEKISDILNKELLYLEDCGKTIEVLGENTQN